MCMYKIYVCTHVFKGDHCIYIYIDTLCVLQQEKLAALNKRKLPEELLEELTEASGKKQKTVGQKERPGKN